MSLGDSFISTVMLGGVSAPSPAKHRYPSLSLSSHHHGPPLTGDSVRAQREQLLRGYKTSLVPTAKRQLWGLQSVGKGSSKSSEMRSCSRREGAQGRGTLLPPPPPSPSPCEAAGPGGTRRGGLGWTITDQEGVEGQGCSSRVTCGVKTFWEHPKGDCELCSSCSAPV